MRSNALTPERLQEIAQREKNVRASTTLQRIVARFRLSDKKVLDIGCGFGEYLQCFGEGSVGITTTPEEVAYGVHIGRDIRLGNAEALDEVLKPKESFDVFWANNLLEHLLSPHAFLVRLKQFARPDSLLILGTPVVPMVPALTKIKKFRGALATPHINFFMLPTYRLTVQYAGWHIEEISPFFFSSSLLNRWGAPFAPHLYLVARNNPHYRYPPKKVKEWEHDARYRPLLSLMGTQKEDARE